MSEVVQGVVVCHGDLAAALVDAAERISGVSGALIPVSNIDCDRASLEQRIVDAIAGRPAVVFVDLATGSCTMAALRGLRDHDRVRVVTGTNLAMLVDFLFHRDLEPDGAASRAVSKGAEAIGSR